MEQLQEENHMTQPITDYSAFLTEAKKAVEGLTQDKGIEMELKMEEKRLEKAIEAERKAVSDSINSTVRRRVDEINASYDQEINKGQDRLKKIRAKREKAKNQGMRERIAEETAELHAHNRELRIKIKALFQKNRVPKFCNTYWFYALYFAKSLKEILFFLLTVLFFYLLVPYGTYLVLPEKSPVYLFGIYFITIVATGGLYLFINNKTKVPHLESLKEGRIIRDVIYSNNKKIKVITGSIRRDKDEKIYNLEKFDDQIAQIEQELAEVTQKKKEALNTFETVTRTIIGDEITSNSKDRIEKMRAEHEITSCRLKEMEMKVKEEAIYVTDHFEPYLGKEFLVPSRIEELAGIIRSGRASNLSEAMAVYKNPDGNRVV